ncbi:MAG: recombinase family protein [Clostridia bacterium]|nr:recombinase family protein [Clostridia bacterium]
MNVRTIPYGYRYENGAVTINPNESEIIQRIFSEYLHGQSLLNIAADLNNDCIEYRPGVIGWNKSRIMRLIEDERYIGTDTFPALITQETHTHATMLKLQKSTQRETNRKDAIYNLNVPMYCPQCGGIMKRQHNTRGNERWGCRNPECGVSFSLPDTTLLAELTIILNHIIEDPEIIHEIPSEYEPNTELQYLKNEISRTLEGYGFDKAALRQKMLEYTSRRYAEIDPNKYITIKLKADFEKSGPLSEFSTELFQLTVKSIYLETNGNVGITLLNGQRIGKE